MQSRDKAIRFGVSTHNMTVLQRPKNFCFSRYLIQGSDLPNILTADFLKMLHSWCVILRVRLTALMHDNILPAATQLAIHYS